jgi:uncharacterized protein (DUF2336 family)
VQIALFDDLLLRLSAEIEVKARATLSQRLAPIEKAPPKLIRSLAFDDAIEVAAPVLTSSLQLTDEDLIENAKTKSQDHLYAISQRLKLNEAVTDVLVERGDRRVVRLVARNDGARFSLAGYEKLVEHSSRDRTLALTVGRRSDIPRQYFVKLLENASASVREKLEAGNPRMVAMIRDAIADVAVAMQSEARESSRHHKTAMRDAKRRFKAHRISEANVHGPASSQEFEKTVVALSILGRFRADLVERALLDEGTDMVIILSRASGCSWLTAKALLLMEAAKRRLSEEDLHRAFMNYERLTGETARRVLTFHERREKLRKAETKTKDSHNTKELESAPRIRGTENTFDSGDHIQDRMALAVGE